MTLGDCRVMRIRPISLLRALLFLSLLQFLVDLSVPAASARDPNNPQSFSVSGKVASLSEGQLTLSINRDHKTLNTLAFVLDSKTQIEGALVVGALAKVDYRTEGEHLIATRIVATPASGVSPY